MKKPIILSYVKQVSSWRKFVSYANRVLGRVSPVNVLNKKSCGALPMQEANKNHPLSDSGVNSDGVLNELKTSVKFTGKINGWDCWEPV